MSLGSCVSARASTKASNVTLNIKLFNIYIYRNNVTKIKMYVYLDWCFSKWAGLITTYLISDNYIYMSILCVGKPRQNVSRWHAN